MKGYKVITPVQLRFRDLDAMRHVNAPVYFSFLELGRLELFSRIKGKRLELDEIDFIVARLEGDFLSSVKLGQELLLGTRIASVGRSSVVIEQQLTADGKPCFSAKEVLVFYDFKTGQIKPVPDDVRNEAAKYSSEEKLC